MKVRFGLQADAPRPAALTLGCFDGVHLGHQAVLRQTVASARARGLGSAWITFDPHPRCVLDPANCPQQITTLEERIALVEPFGLNRAFVLEFNRELAALSASDFMERVERAMTLRHLVTGPDFAFGRGRTGNVAWLEQDGQERGYTLEVVAPFAVEGRDVHSSDVRRFLILGEVDQAQVLLGRPYVISGLVERGDQIGRQIGWPTVNLTVPPAKLVPAHGIYAGWATTVQGQFQASISIGYRPTFDKTELRVEAYLLDFKGDLYGQRVELSFISRLREERRFQSAEELAAAIARDVQETRRVLAKGSPKSDRQ